MTRDEAEEALGDESIAMFLDGYDDCIAGISYRFNMEPLVIYDESAILSKLIDGGMTVEEADEFFNFNILGAWVGEGTPLFMHTQT